MNPILLIDGHAILHRAYHAYPPLTGKSGQRIEAVHGFFSILLRLIKDFSPSALAVCFDRPGPTFRQELFKDYQIQRPKMEDALVSQVGPLHQALIDMGIAVFEHDGFEADDIIGTIVKKVKSQKLKVKSTLQNSKIQETAKVIIVTGDRDILQLVDDNAKVYMPLKGLSEGKIFSQKEVQEKMGIPPQQIADWKALVGDSSDNYPGVTGIGPKTAASLVKRFGSLEKIYQNLNKIERKTAQKLEKDKEKAFLLKKLATIVCDVPLEETPLSSFDQEKAKAVFAKLGLKSLVKRLEGKTKKDEEKQMKLF